MRKLILLILLSLFLIIPSQTFAVGYGDPCKESSECPHDSICRPVSDKTKSLCSESLEIPKVFGKIEPPQAIKDFGVGSIGLGTFFNNLITLIYIVSTIAFMFMILISAFEWITSGGEKEKVAQAQKRIVNAVIGIALLAVSFAIINLVGKFTGLEEFFPEI